MKTILQRDLYKRGKPYFKKSELELLIFDVNKEKQMIQAQQDSGAKCFIIGAEKYSQDFYRLIDPNSLVIRFGVGYDNVPIGICQKRGIKVAYTPRTLDQSVVEHAIGLILSCARQIPRTDSRIRNDKWEMESGLELKGKTLAIIGFGKIGQKTARIAKNGFQMKVNVLDVFPKLDGKYSNLVDFYSTDFESVVKDAYFVSLHMAVARETENYIDYSKLKMMKQEAFLINTARGQLVNEEDLYNALKDKIIAGAALDVFKKEPYVPKVAEKDLRNLNNVILTSHIASNTEAANRRMSNLCIKNAVNFYKNKLENVVLIPELREV